MVGSGVAVAAGCFGVPVGVSTGFCVDFAAMISSVCVGAAFVVCVGSMTGSDVGSGCVVGAVVGDGSVGVSARASTGAVVGVAAGAMVGSDALVACCAAGELPPQAIMAIAESASAVIMITLNFSPIFLRIPPIPAV